MENYRPARETMKCYSIQDTKRRLIGIRLPGTSGIRYSKSSYFLRPLSITFATKFICAAIHTSHRNFMHCTTIKGAFYRGFLFMRRKRRARGRSFFSYQVIVLEDSTYKVLVVISGQTGFARKIALNY